MAMRPCANRRSAVAQRPPFPGYTTGRRNREKTAAPLGRAAPAGRSSRGRKDMRLHRIMMRVGIVACLLTVVAIGRVAGSQPTGQAAAEKRVLTYIRDHLRPGQPLLVTELYNQVFTQAEERKALDKLYRAFFRIPFFVAQYDEKFGSAPSLQVIAQQFDLPDAEAADVLLRVMESDPRVPRFLTRDPRTHEITKVDVEAIRGDPKFGQQLEHQLSGWEGKLAPDFRLATLDGREVDSGTLRGKVALLYIWFTGCPPCIKETPALVALNRDFAARGLTIVGANADRLLGLSYDDAVRRRYLRDQGANFTVVHWTKESDTAYGGVSIFPTLFLFDRKGIVIRHWVGFVPAEDLRSAVSKGLAGK
jgi:thiol-disulfide isomerase/thioredoxin